MAKSITVGSFGTIGTVPNNATLKWCPGGTMDNVLLELHEGLTIGELEVLSNTPQIVVELKPINIENYNNIFVKLTYTNTSPTVAIAARKFVLTIRHINTAVVFSTITINYETAYDSLGLTESVIWRQWATNNNYGNGTSTIANEKVIPMLRVPFTYNTADNILIVKDTAKKGMLPKSLVTVQAGRGTIAVVNDGGNPTIATEGANTVSKYKPVVKTLTQGLVPLTFEPVFASLNNAKAGPRTFSIGLSLNMNLTSTGTNAQQNLPWGSSHNIIMSTYYNGLDMKVGSHPTMPRGVNFVSAVFDNQQDDIIFTTPYIWKGRFGCMVQPIQNVTRAGIVGVQLHNHYAWDNGQYISKTVRFDLVAGTNKTPVALVEDTVTVLEGETEPYMVFTPAESFKYTITDPSICSVDQNRSLVNGIKAGRTTVTFKATKSPMIEGSAILTVNVLPIPDASLTVNRRRVIVAVGDTAGITVTATRADSLQFKQTPDGLVTIMDFTTYTKNTATVSGRVNFRGEKVGNTIVTIESYFRTGKQLTETIEIEVIPRGTYKIVADPTKLKVDIKKNSRERGKFVPFWATTNAKYIKWEYPPNESFELEGTPVYETFDVKVWPKTKRGKYIITLYGHMLDPNTRVCTLEIPIKVIKNVEVPKDEIWVGLEHKQIGYKDDEDLDERYFTILKWLKRDKIEKITGHRLRLPSRNGTLLTKKMLKENSKYSKRYYEYAKDSMPTRLINPPKINVMWLDTSTGLVWKCIDNTKNSNVWVSEDGKQIGKVEQLSYPKPGEKGFGVGPMSYDLHEKYGLTPMEGCFDVNSDNYGNYTDEYGNVYVCIPKHYIKLSNSSNN